MTFIPLASTKKKCDIKAQTAFDACKTGELVKKLQGCRSRITGSERKRTLIDTMGDSERHPGTTCISSLEADKPSLWETGNAFYLITAKHNKKTRLHIKRTKKRKPPEYITYNF